MRRQPALTNELETSGDRRVLPEDRRAAIVRLLEGLTDGLPLPARAPMSTLGFVHRTSQRESCPDCLANGFVSRDCESCAGRGYVEERRIRDPYDTGLAPGWFGSSAAKHERDHERDRVIDQLEAQTAPPRSEADLLRETPEEPWVKARERLRDEFDFAALERALELLQGIDVDAYRAVHAVHVYGWMPARGSAAVAVERALVFVDPWLPDPVRAPSAARVAEVPLLTRAARNREIRRLGRDGAASQWVAARFGLSVATVNRVLAGDDREAAA